MKLKELFEILGDRAFLYLYKYKDYEFIIKRQNTIFRNDRK